MSSHRQSLDSGDRYLRAENKAGRWKPAVQRGTINHDADEGLPRSSDMSGTRIRLMASTIISSVLIFAIGGCPTAVDGLIELGDEPVVAAGVYWVEDFDGELLYFDLGRTRGDEGRWVTIDDADVSWYTLAGPHEFDATDGWRRIADAGSVTLDDMIQLHDAAPKLPSISP